MFRKVVALLAVVGLVLSQYSSANAAEQGFSVDPSKRLIASLKPCSTDLDLDCIDSVGLVAADGTVTPQKFLKYQAQSNTVDSNGNPTERGTSLFENVSVEAQLETPKHVIYKTMTGGAMRLFLSPDAKHAKSKFKIAVRTSWLKPQDIQLKVLDADYTKTDIKGGTLWTFSGIQTQMSYYNSATNAENKKKMDSGAKADSTLSRFEIFVHHSDPAGSYFDTRCDSAGFTVESHNAPGAGVPFWNPTTKSLDFNIQAPHRNSSGALNQGFFKFWASDAYMDCAWPGNTLTTAKAILVSIIYEDGQAQVATSFIKREGGQLVVSVENLHFSSPTIRVSAAGETAVAPIVQKPTPAKPVAKLKSITCVNSKNKKVTKKVTALKPVCPAGYKQG